MTYDFYPTNKQHHGKRAKTHDHNQHAGGAKARVVCDVHHDNGAFTLRCHPETHQKHKTHPKKKGAAAGGMDELFDGAIAASQLDNLLKN